QSKELVSLILYKICNPKRSDSKIEEHVEEVEDLKAEAELFRSGSKIEKHVEELEDLKAEAELFRLKAISGTEELKAVADVKRLRTILENNSGTSEECKGEMLKEDLFLPSDLVRLILSRLSFKDNIRSSTVCKAWGDIAASVRVKSRRCWLLYHDAFQDKGVSYGFFDPVEKKKTKEMNLPELSKSSGILYSKDGWLLMNDSLSLIADMYFFNPFTRERIDLPRNRIMESVHTNFAFSCAPTKKSCLVFGINNIFSSLAIKISTWRPGATTWLHEDFPNLFPSYFRRLGNILYSDGLFYTASETALGVFDPTAHTWNVLPVQPIPMAPRSIRWMTEYEGHIFLVDASSLEPMVYRLNRLESVWEKKETLDGSSIFLSDGSCVMTYGLTGSMSNILYFWSRFINERRSTKSPCPFSRNHPYKYSLYSRSSCEDPEGYYFEYLTWGQKVGVWIEPPHSISIYDYSILDPSEAVNTEYVFI
ncbi:F-box domain, partial [Arabidopsis suecica]